MLPAVRTNDSSHRLCSKEMLLEQELREFVCVLETAAICFSCTWKLFCEPGRRELYLEYRFELKS